MSKAWGPQGQNSAHNAASLAADTGMLSKLFAPVAGQLRLAQSRHVCLEAASRPACDHMVVQFLGVHAVGCLAGHFKQLDRTNKSAASQSPSPWLQAWGFRLSL